MNREIHVRICGGLEVKLLRSTRLTNRHFSGMAKNLPAGAGRLSSVPCAAYPQFTTDFGLVVIPPEIEFSKN